jgi:hypothetical protein
VDSLAVALLLSVVDKATAPLRVVGKALDAVAKSGEGLKKAGEGMRIARENVDDFTGRMKAGLEAVLAPAADVETALNKLAADSGPAMANVATTLDHVRASALAWSSVHANSAASYIAETNAMMKVTNNEAAAIKGAEVALRVSTGTSKDAAGVAETLGIVYGQMGDKSKDAGAEFARLGDILTRAHQTFAGIDIASSPTRSRTRCPLRRPRASPSSKSSWCSGSSMQAGIKGGEAGASFAAVLDLDARVEGARLLCREDVGRRHRPRRRRSRAIEKKFGSLKTMTPEMTAKMQAAFGPEAFKAMAALSGRRAR